MNSLERALQHAERAEAAYASARESAGYNQGLNEARQNTEREMALMRAQVALAERSSVHATVLPVDFGSPGNPDLARQPENGQETSCDEHKAAYFDSGYAAGLKDALDPSIVVKDWDPWYARPYVATAAPSGTSAVITLQEFDDPRDVPPHY